MNQEKQQDIIKILNKKIGSAPCPMCGNKHFILADGYFCNSIQDNFNNITIGGKNVPAIAVICQNCGFISQHALGILGLLQQGAEVQDEVRKK